MRKSHVAGVLVFSVAIAAAAAAGGQAPKVVGKPERVKIATFDAKSGKVANISRELLAETFEDGVPIKDVRVEKMGATYYLVREGQSGKNHRIARTRLAGDPKTGALTLEVYAGGTSGAMARRRFGATESCTGDPCSKCGFLLSGGCSCNSPTDPVGAHCNHTISKFYPILK